MTRDVLNEIHKHSIYNETEVKNKMDKTKRGKTNNLSAFLCIKYQ